MGREVPTPMGSSFSAVGSLDWKMRCCPTMGQRPVPWPSVQRETLVAMYPDSKKTELGLSGLSASFPTQQEGVVTLWL